MALGFLEGLVMYFWNQGMFFDLQNSLIVCWMVGGWGLFWSNDQGILTNRCYELLGGAQTTWPLPYKSIYGEYAKGNVVKNF